SAGDEERVFGVGGPGRQPVDPETPPLGQGRLDLLGDEDLLRHGSRTQFHGHFVGRPFGPSLQCVALLKVVRIVLPSRRLGGVPTAGEASSSTRYARTPGNPGRPAGTEQPASTASASSAAVLMGYRISKAGVEGQREAEMSTRPQFRLVTISEESRAA